MEQTLSSRRPLGVTIIAVLLIIGGILGLVLGILALVAAFSASHAIIVHGHTTIAHIVDTIGVVLGGSSIVLGLLTLLFAWGLWTLKRWAFWLTVIFEAITLLRYALELVQPHASLVSIITPMIIPVVILIYFLADSHVRRAFRV